VGQQVQQPGQQVDIVLAPHQRQLGSSACPQDDRQHRVTPDAAATTAPAAASAGLKPSAAAAAAEAAGSGAAGTSSSGPQQAAGWQAPELRLSDIDPDVLCELPIEIQLEVRRAARAGVIGSGQQAGSRGRGGAGRQGKGGGGGRQQQGVQHGSISKYFKKSS
jgi:hypothetical protein